MKSLSQALHGHQRFRDHICHSKGGVDVGTTKKMLKRKPAAAPLNCRQVGCYGMLSGDITCRRPSPQFYFQTISARELQEVIEDSLRPSPVGEQRRRSPNRRFSLPAYRVCSALIDADRSTRQTPSGQRCAPPTSRRHTASAAARTNRTS